MRSLRSLFIIIMSLLGLLFGKDRDFIFTNIEND